MSPDDPRHGSNAGATKHVRDREPLCDPCMVARRAARKRRELDGITLVTLGQDAWRILDESPPRHLSTVGNIPEQTVFRLRAAGPNAKVRKSTRDKIIAAEPGYTYAGIQRRLRALAVLGWSLQALAERTGIARETLGSLRRNESDNYFVHRRTAALIVAAYDDLIMRPAPPSHSSRGALSKIPGDWLPPLAWDDIDAGTRPGYMPPRIGYDHAKVERILSGDWHLHAHPVERREVVRRWLATGRTVRELEALTGWDIGRQAWPKGAA